MPLVTVGMVTYNAAPYLRMAIESILGQTYTNFELIISDDESTDETWSIIQSYQDLRIKAFRNKNNIGEYPNRNKVLAKASGKYLIYIDGDDVLYPHGLELMTRMLEAFPESAMALSLPPRSNFIYPCELTPRQIYLFDFFCRNSINHHGFPYTFFRTDVLKKVGPFPEEIKTGDTYIKKLISLDHKVVLIPDGTAWWRTTPGQASESLRKDMSGKIEALKYHQQLLNNDKCPLTSEEKKIAVTNLKGLFMREVIHCYVFRLRLLVAWRVCLQAGLSWRDIPYILKKPDFYYNGEGDSVNPMTDFTKNPFLKKIPATLLVNLCQLKD